jgi:hypothetical protein
MGRGDSMSVEECQSWLWEEGLRLKRIMVFDRFGCQDPGVRLLAE